MAEGAHQPCLLGHVEKVRRSEKSAVGVPPPDEGFQSGHPLGRHVDDRLVEDHELALGGAPAKVGLQLEPAVDRDLHARLEHFEPVPSGPLGRVHGRVGVAQQLLGRVVAI